jgi:hypothetical protein
VTAAAIERVARYFARLQTRPGILARRLLELEDPSDRALAARLAAAAAADVRPDGSVSGGAVSAIWRGHELLDLGAGSYDPTVRRVGVWLLDRQGGPGAYGAGCDRLRHRQRICEHYVQGFFTPAPPEQRLAPITLPNGKAFRTEPAARFAISCLGLRLALRSGLGDRPAVARHLESLRVLTAQWTSWSGFFPPDVIVAGLHALAFAGPRYRTSVTTLVDLVAAHQRDDGLWPNADFFATLDALVVAEAPTAREVVQRTVPALRERQRADGAFGATAQQERALIALRALMLAEGRTGAEPAFPVPLPHGEV